jgi:hypothetical protein
MSVVGLQTSNKDKHHQHSLIKAPLITYFVVTCCGGTNYISVLENTFLHEEKRLRIAWGPPFSSSNEACVSFALLSVLPCQTSRVQRVHTVARVLKAIPL